MLVLMYAGALLGLSVVLLFEDKLRALWVSQLVLGVGYLAWGFAHTSGVPDSEVSVSQMAWIYSGLYLTLIGIGLGAAWWYRDVMRRMPRH